MAIKVDPKYEVTYAELNALMQAKAAAASVDGKELAAVELLAIASNMVGKLIALQDQRHMSKDRAMRIVAENIQLGNLQIIEQLRDSKPAGTA